MSTNEWYTPSRYVEAARQVMGSITLDPASCAFANQIVKADCYYSKEENGLNYPWFGNVWLNPPYGKTLQGGASNLAYFTGHLLEQYECGNTKQAILLIPVNSITTSWFASLWDFSLCFPWYRIRFLLPNGKQSDGPSLGTCFVYLGMNIQRFIEVFSEFGTIAGRISEKRNQAKNLSLLWEVRQ
jgi:hypothetical protein